MSAVMRRLTTVCAHARAPTVRRSVPAYRVFSAQSAEEGPLTRCEVGEGGVAKITLCRPKKLNSLSIPMIRELAEHYKHLESTNSKCVFLTGEGRALCAGGDVAEIREGILEGNTVPADFFYEEFSLDYRIATMHKRTGITQVALWDGIVMGGGVGLSTHSPIRIATEKTMFAMPETLIGLFPDVGMTWALSRISGGVHVGLYLGLVGSRLGAADCLASGLATHYCPSEKLPMVEEKIRALGKDGTLNSETAAKIVNEVAGGAVPDEAKSILGKNAAAIERCFGGNVKTAEDIVANLKKETCDWSQKALKELLARSPTSVKITLEAVKKHQSASFAEAFRTEYRLTQWCMRKQPQSDFCEGIRAVLVDKDNNPSWQPSALENVSAEKVQEFFAPLPATHPRGELDVEL